MMVRWFAEYIVNLVTRTGVRLYVRTLSRDTVELFKPISSVDASLGCLWDLKKDHTRLRRP